MYREKSNAEPKKSNAERQACYRADKLFRTLPLDVQHTILSISSDEEFKQRTVIALDYQYKHGKRPCTGMDCHIPASTAKPGDDDYHTHTGPDEGCSQCHSTLPRLEQPRQYPGMCMVCVVKGAA